MLGNYSQSNLLYEGSGQGIDIMVGSLAEITSAISFVLVFHAYRGN